MLFRSLSAVAPDDLRHFSLAGVLERALERAGYTTQTFSLATTQLAFCQGEFDCWVRTPGTCKSADAEQEIVKSVHESDLVVLFGPETFGGHGYLLKRVLDRFICLITPFFEVRRSLTHHTARYDHAPRFLALGWQSSRNEERAHTFAELADANALNLLAPTCGAAIVDDEHPESWDATIEALLASKNVPGAEIHDREPLTKALIEAATADAAPRIITSAAFLIGSAKPKGTSSSEALARALGERLAHIGVSTSYAFATEFVRDDEPARAAARTLAHADLLVIATPLYVDSLPALATHALELVAAERAGVQDEARVVALINCGFPEPEHIRTALRVVRHFAQSASMGFAGGLPLGGGGSIVGKSLDTPGHGAAAHVVQALDAASISLVRFGQVSPEAISAMVERPMPDMMYRLAGDVGFRWAARNAGVSQGDLRNRPLDTPHK